MSDSHPIMALLLEHNTFLGHAEMPENEIMPLANQLSFGVGDCAILAGSNLPVERDFALAKAIDPEKHAKTFPDWEERMLNSYVLCEIFTRADPELSIGWVSRLKLMQIPKYRYKEAKHWIKDGFPDSLPDWANKAYRVYTDALAERAPEVVPLQVTCPKCGKRDVELVITRRIEYRVNAGQVKRGEDIKYVPLHPPEETSTHSARLVCKNCGASADLEDEEWQLAPED